MTLSFSLNNIKTKKVKKAVNRGLVVEAVMEILIDKWVTETKYYNKQNGLETAILNIPRSPNSSKSRHIIVA